MDKLNTLLEQFRNDKSWNTSDLPVPFSPPPGPHPAHALVELREKGELSLRSCNCLLRAGFNTMEDVVARVEGLDTLKKIRNMGPHSLAEVLTVAHELGLKWRWEE